MKINFLLIFCIVISCTSLKANPLDSIQEVFPYENPEYIGYRLALTNISVTPADEEGYINLSYTGVNTGRKDLYFEDNTTPPPSLVVTFDQTLHQHRLISFAKIIRDEIILNSNFQVAAGKITKRKTIKISIKSPEDETVDQDTDILESPRFQPSKKQEEVLTAKSPPVEDFESSLMGSVVQQYDENACSDLVFESIKIVKKTKSKVILEYTIINQGEGPASLITNRKKENQNMALTAYLSSKDKVTKSSFSFDGDFIEKGLDKTNGKLYPGKRYTSTIKLNIQKMTKFTPYVILELDPYLSIRECDKKNNKLGVKVGEGIER